MYAGKLVAAAGGVLLAACFLAPAGAGELGPVSQSGQDPFADATALDVEELGDTIVRDAELGPGAVPITAVTVRIGNQDTVVVIKQGRDETAAVPVGASVKDRVSAAIEDIEATKEAERKAAAEATRLAAEEEARKAAQEAARLAAIERVRKAKEEAARLAAEEKVRKAAEESARLAADEAARKAAEERMSAGAEEAARRAAEGREVAAVAEKAAAAEDATTVTENVEVLVIEKAARQAAEGQEAAAVEEKAATVPAGGATVEVAVAEEAKALLSPEKAALLTDDEIMTLIVGNTMTGFTHGGWWSEYYAPDGTIRGKWRSARYLAKWKVNGGRMCFDYPIEGRNFCLMLRLSDDQVFAYQEDGTGGDRASKLLPGNPKNL
jgi:hypothetical protein